MPPHSLEFGNKMKRVIDRVRATGLLNNGFVSRGVHLPTPAAYSQLLDELEEVLIAQGKSAGYSELDSFAGVCHVFQDDHAFRLELGSWVMLQHGLLDKLAEFLRLQAPDYAIIMTFDFEDDDERSLESPTIVVFADEIVAEFDDCDCIDTPLLLGFRMEAEQETG